MSVISFVPLRQLSAEEYEIVRSEVRKLSLTLLADSANTLYGNHSDGTEWRECERRIEAILKPCFRGSALERVRAWLLLLDCAESLYEFERKSVSELRTEVRDALKEEISNRVNARESEELLEGLCARYEDLRKQANEYILELSYTA